MINELEALLHGCPPRVSLRGGRLNLMDADLSHINDHCDDLSGGVPNDNEHCEPEMQSTDHPQREGGLHE